MAGSSMKDIKLRIRSVESTLQITKAMQLVATSKMRRARERMENSRPYAAVSREAVCAAARRCDDPQSIYIRARSDAPKRCYVIIAGERGLAGGYNANVFRAVEAHAEGKPYCVLPMGRKAVEKYTRLKVETLSAEYTGVENVGVGRCFALGIRLTRRYKAGDFGELWLVYTAFHSMMSQEVQLEPLLPLTSEEVAGAGPSPVATVYEPAAGETLEMLMPGYIAGRLYSALCDSFASEVAARRNAMDSATKNAGAMIDDLTLKFNRARQGAITQEITEIVAGADE